MRVLTNKNDVNFTSLVIRLANIRSVPVIDVTGSNINIVQQIIAQFSVN